MQDEQNPSCLRCRHCSLLPETNFRKSDTKIQCGLTGHHQIFSVHPCLFNSPTDRRVTAHHDSPVIAWLRVYYPLLEMEKLMIITHSSRNTIHHYKKKFNLPKRWGTAIHSKEARNGIRRHRNWTDEQDEYILSLPDEKWPKKGTPSRNSYGARLLIVQAVERRGKHHAWTDIVKRRYDLSPAGQRSWKKRNERIRSKVKI